MATGAIGSVMGSNQGKPGHPMNIRDVINDPGGWRMASSAVGANRLFMNISMTFKTFRLCILENQGDMA